MAAVQTQTLVDYLQANNLLVHDSASVTGTFDATNVFTAHSTAKLQGAVEQSSYETFFQAAAVPSVTDANEARIYMDSGKLKISESGGDYVDLYNPVKMEHELYVSASGQSAAAGATGNMTLPFATIQQAIDFASNTDPDPKYRSGFAVGEPVIIHVGPGEFAGFSLKRRQTYIRGAGDNAADLSTKITSTVTINPSTADANDRYSHVYALKGLFISPTSGSAGVVASGSVSGANGQGVYTLNMDNCYVYTGSAAGTTHYAVHVNNTNTNRARVAIANSIINVASGAAPALKLDTGDVRMFFSQLYATNNGASSVSAITLAGTATLWISSAVVDVNVKSAAIDARGAYAGIKLIVTDSGVANSNTTSGAHGIYMENTSAAATKVAAVLNNVVFTVGTTAGTLALTGSSGANYVHGDLRFAPLQNSSISASLVSIAYTNIMGPLTTTLNSVAVSTGIPTTLGGTLAVSGNSTLSGTLAVTGASTTLSGTLDVGGATTLTGALTANGAVTTNSSVTANGAVTVAAGGSLTTTGPATTNGSLTTNGSVTANGAVTVAAGGSLTAAGPVTTNGTLTANGNVSITGNSTLTGTLLVQNNSTLAGALTQVTSSGGLTIDQSINSVAAANVTGLVEAGQALVKSGGLTVTGATVLATTTTGALTAASAFVGPSNYSSLSAGDKAAADAATQLQVPHGITSVHELVVGTGGALLDFVDVTNNATVGDTLTAYNANVTHALNVGSAQTAASAKVYGTLETTDVATLQSASVSSTLNVTGAAALSSTLSVAQKATLADVDVSGVVNLGAGKMMFTPSTKMLHLGNNAATAKLTVSGASGDLYSAGSLSIDGSVAVGGALDVTGATTLDGALVANASVTTHAPVVANDSVTANDLLTVNGSLQINAASNFVGNASIITVRDSSNVAKVTVSPASGAIDMAGTLTADHIVAAGASSTVSSLVATNELQAQQALLVKGVDADPVVQAALNSKAFSVTASTGAVAAYDVNVAHDLAVAQDATVAGTLEVTQKVTAKDDLQVDGKLVLAGNLEIGGNIVIPDTLLQIVTSLSPAELVSQGDSKLVLGQSSTAANSGVDVYGLATFKNDVKINGDLELVGDIKISDNLLSVLGGQDLSELVAETPITMNGALTVNNTVTVNNGASALFEVAPAAVSSSVDVKVNTDKFVVSAASGNTAVAGTLSTGGKATLALADVTGALVVGAGGFASSAYVHGTLETTGKATLESAEIVNGFAIGGAMGVTGDFAVNTDKFTVAAASGNTAVAGTLNVAGAASLASTLDVSGAVSVTNSLSVSSLSLLNSVNVSDIMTVGGAASLSSTLSTAAKATLHSLEVSNGSDLLGNLNVNDKFAVAAASGNVSTDGTLSVAGNVAVNTDKFTVTAASGNVVSAGSVTAQQASFTTGDFSSTLECTDDFWVNTDSFIVLAASGNTTVKGTLSTGAKATLHSADVTNALNVSGNVAVNTDKFTVAAASGNTVVAGTLTAGNSLLASAEATNSLTTKGLFTVQDPTDANVKLTVATSGNLETVGSLSATGLSIVGDSSFTGHVTVPAPAAGTDATHKTYVDDQDALKVAKAGDSMSGFLTLSADPSSAMHAVTKNYADVELAKKENVWYNVSPVETTGSAPTNCLSLPMPAGDNWSAIYNIMVSGSKGTTDRAAFMMIASFAKKAGVLSQQGSTFTPFKTTDVPSVNATVNVVGSEMHVLVTGEANESWLWQASANMTGVVSSA